MEKENEVLKVIEEVTILGKKIKFYNSLDNPLFLAKDVAIWIDYSVSNVGKMLSNVDNDERTTRKFCTNGSNYNTEAWFLTEDGLYECCMNSRKPIAKQMKKEIKRYLKSIRLTGGTIEKGRESEMVEYYFSQFSDDTKLAMVRELEMKNEELQNKLDEAESNWKTLTDCTGTFSMNQIAHLVGVGEYTLFEYLRKMKILFKNEDNDNIPYEKPIHKDKFCVVPAIASNGVMHSQTRVYPKGIKYIMMRLRKAGYLHNKSEVA